MIIPLKRKKFTIFAEDMEDERFIQVILPLRLEWEPYYLVPEELSVAVGDRVQVEFANKRYVGVVSAVDVKPADELKPRILYIVGREPDLPPVGLKEIRFWRDVADYYLCTVGEVYKAALARDAKALSARKIPAIEPHDIQLSSLQEEAAQKAREAFAAHKTVLLHGVTGAGKTEIYLKLAQDVLQRGRSVLFLVPEIALSRQLEERVAAVFPEVLVYHSAQTPARRAQVATAIREGEKYIVLGTRSALFLPHRNLGLIIVDEEHDSSFKQDSPAPRYHAREASIMLGLTHDAAVLLGSATPSLESLYNAETGKFVKIDLKERFHSGKEADLLIIDTVAERRKNGMAGSFSLKLLACMKESLEVGEQVLLLGPPRASLEARQIEQELAEYFPEAVIGSDILVGSAYVAKAFEHDALGLVAVLAADNILARQDFRADERTLQVLEQFRSRCSRFVIQTRQPHHPVFSELANGGDPTGRILAERQQFGLPPYTRLIHVNLRDKMEKRVSYMAAELARSLSLPLVGPYAPLAGRLEDSHLRQIRIMLPRDKNLRASKHQLLLTVNEFEKAQKYSGHIVLDVDPL